MCGGITASLQASIDEKGLSPRVRGNQVKGALDHADYGSIPACAGEPAAMPRTPRPTAVYPRVCGGTESRAKPSSAMRGLSPRVRGNRNQQYRKIKAGRSIPACAGEPFALSAVGRLPRVYPRVCGGTRSPSSPF